MMTLTVLGVLLVVGLPAWRQRQPQRPTFQPAPPPYSRERPRLADEKFQAEMQFAVSGANRPVPKERP